jgi:hypothetical protein
MQDQRFARRGLQAPEAISSQTVVWLASLPVDIRPLLLPVQYTRITNALCRLWGTPDQCLRYLEDLLTDRRGDRQGFILDIAMELAGLKNHYETEVRRVPQTAWEQIIEHRLS